MFSNPFVGKLLVKLAKDIELEYKAKNVKMDLWTGVGLEEKKNIVKRKRRTKVQRYVPKRSGPTALKVVDNDGDHGVDTDGDDDLSTPTFTGFVATAWRNGKV